MKGKPNATSPYNCISIMLMHMSLFISLVSSLGFSSLTSHPYNETGIYNCFAPASRSRLNFFPLKKVFKLNKIETLKNGENSPKNPENKPKTANSCQISSNFRVKMTLPGAINIKIFRYLHIYGIDFSVRGNNARCK